MSRGLESSVERDVRNWGVDPTWARRRIVAHKATKAERKRFALSMAMAWAGATQARPLPSDNESLGPALSLSRGVGSKP